MTGQAGQTGSGIEAGGVKRRRLMAGAAALVAGLLAREVVDSPRVAAITNDDHFFALGNGGRRV